MSSFTWRVPPVTTSTPGKWAPEGGKQIEKCPRNYNVVVQRDKEGNQEHGATHTWNGRKSHITHIPCEGPLEM